MRVSLIVAAGGTGSRFAKKVKRTASTPRTKLFFELAGKPVLVRTLQAFQPVREIREVIVTAPKASLAEVRGMLRQAGLSKVRVTAGGSTRAASVLNGLRAARHPWVLVHDGARPLVSPKAVSRLIKEGAKADGALLASPVAATVKAVKAGSRIIDRTLDRRLLYTAETPQMARRAVLLKAYRRVDALNATDEASLLEAEGLRVRVVTHDGWNPKITTVEDLRLVNAFLASTGTGLVPRTGFGRDTHRLVKGRPFWLGGLRIPHDLGPQGHSDGDALLHAIVDALLGVMGKGDIGDWFSDKSPKFKDMASSRFVEAVMKEARSSGWKVIHCDTVVTLERPKLGAWKKKMAAKIAGLLGLKVDDVSVKGKTAEGLGVEGKGLAVTAEALVTMVRS